MSNYNIKITFTEPLLGTAPLNKEIYEEYIMTRGPVTDDVLDEVTTIEDDLEKGRTGFHRLDGGPILYDYLFRGFFKEACGVLKKAKFEYSAKLTAHKKVIDGMVFVFPRRVPIHVVGDIEWLERPLRASTAQGERIALASSEMIGIGSWCEFEVKILDDKIVSRALLDEWLQYGSLKGLGQWRNASYGRFEYEMK